MPSILFEANDDDTCLRVAADNTGYVYLKVTDGDGVDIDLILSPDEAHELGTRLVNEAWPHTLTSRKT